MSTIIMIEIIWQSRLWSRMLVWLSTSVSVGLYASPKNNFKVMNDRSHIGGNLRSRIVLYHMKKTFIAKVMSILKPSI